MLTIKKLYKDKKNGQLYGGITKSGYLYGMDHNSMITQTYKSHNPDDYDIIYLVLYECDDPEYNWDIMELPTEIMAKNFILDFELLQKFYKESQK